MDYGTSCEIESAELMKPSIYAPHSMCQRIIDESRPLSAED